MQRFSTILADLRAAVAARASRTRALETLLVLVWQRLSRMAQRFERLVQLWRDGRLPKARARVAAESRPMAQPAGDQPEAIEALVQGLEDGRAAQVLMGVTGSASGVAHFAHLGGMLGGFLMLRYWRGQSPFSGRRR